MFGRQSPFLVFRMKGDFYLGPWLVQPSLDRMSLEGRIVQVRPKVMDLLVYLASSARSR